MVIQFGSWGIAVGAGKRSFRYAETAQTKYDLLDLANRIRADHENSPGRRVVMARQPIATGQQQTALRVGLADRFVRP